MPQYETISSFCYDNQNKLVLNAADIFMDNFEEITGNWLEIPSTPAEPVDINDRLGFDLEESTGEDVVIFDILHANKRTLLYVSHAPKGDAVILYSALKNKFQSNAIYEEYTLENESAYVQALKEAFSFK